MKNAMTYGQMFRKLQALGFTLKRLEIDGKRQLVFTHAKDETAMLAFSDIDLKEVVPPIHLAAVRGILNSHGIASANGVPTES